MFEEYGAILGSGTCARCGSKSKLRGLQRVNTHIVVCHATCNKCHLVQFTGFTSVDELAYQAVKQKFEKLLEKSESPSVKAQISKNLEKLAANKELRDLGL